jgi:glycosyltransferase involved in cell wall biosynthesis
MKVSPLVSIITPTYNHEKYISDCINSVLNQTYTNWEMIIVNDGSTDETLSVCQFFAERDNRIQIISKQNIGIFRLAENYNAALKISKGDYIGVLEGDDLWEPEKLNWQVQAMEDNSDAVISWGKAYQSSMDLAQNYGLSPHLKYNEQIFNNSPVKSALPELLFSNFIPALTVLIRKKALDKIGGFQQGFGLPLVDLPTWQALSLFGKFIYINKPLGMWRVTTNQVTKTYTIRMIEGVYRLALVCFENNKSFFTAEKITTDKIHRHFKGRLIVNYCHSANFKLKRKDIKGARSDFNQSLLKYGFIKPTWKLRAAFGILRCIVLSLFNANEK